MTLPCCVCRKHLENAIDFDTDDVNQPRQGLEFTTEGHYGSTYFDPMDGSLIAVNICDDCLRRLANEGLVKEYGI